MKLINTFLAILLITALPLTLFSQVKSIGIPKIKNYKRAEYKGGTQNWNIDQDANNSGLIQHEDSKWN